MVAIGAMELRLLLSALICAISAGGCAGDPERYPSLAIRDFEKTSGQFVGAATSAVPEVIPPVASQSEIDQLLVNAQAADQKFQATRPGVRESVRRGRGQATDSLTYTDALLGLAELSSLRSDTALALGEIDLLHAQAKTRFAPTDNIAAAQIEILAMLAQQDAAMAQLWSLMDR